MVQNIEQLIICHLSIYKFTNLGSLEKPTCTYIFEKLQNVPTVYK